MLHSAPRILSESCSRRMGPALDQELAARDATLHAERALHAEEKARLTATVRSYSTHFEFFENSFFDTFLIIQVIHF